MQGASRLAVSSLLQLAVLRVLAGRNHASLQLLDLKTVKLKKTCLPKVRTRKVARIAHALLQDIVCHPPLPVTSNVLTFNPKGRRNPLAAAADRRFDTGTFLAVCSPRACHAVRLPKQGVEVLVSSEPNVLAVSSVSLLQSGLAEKAEALKCRSYPIGSYFYSSNPGEGTLSVFNVCLLTRSLSVTALRIVQASWHPQRFAARRCIRCIAPADLVALLQRIASVRADIGQSAAGIQRRVQPQRARAGV